MDTRSIIHAKDSNPHFAQEFNLDYSRLLNYIDKNSRGQLLGRGLDPNFRPPLGGIYEYQLATINGENGWIYDDAGNHLEFLTWFAGLNDDKSQKLRARVSKRSAACLTTRETVLEGNTLSLLSDWASENWGHFVLDSISKLALLKKHKISLDQFDQILVPDFPGNHARYLLDLTISDTQKLIKCRRGKNFKATNLWAISIPAYKRCYSADVTSYYQGLVNDTNINEPNLFIRYYNRSVLRIHTH